MEEAEQFLHTLCSAWKNIAVIFVKGIVDFKNSMIPHSFSNYPQQVVTG